MRLQDTGDRWWQHAIGYCLDVERFHDADGNGHGDLAGVSQRIDHLVRLGVDLIWLQPFYPSPEDDDGYDISDYYAVDPDVGTLGDVVELIRVARERGIRVIVDLVVNHTSSDHAWFQSARADPGSPYRDWYVWRDEPDPADADADVMFPDQETSLWSRDEQARLYYRHQFYRHQPDLNTANPHVRAEILRIMGFWLQLGVAGFRVDAAPYMAATASDRDRAGALAEPMELLDVMRSFLSRRSAEAVMLGEVNVPYEEQKEFFGSWGDRMTLLFDFVLNQRMWLALARGDAGPIRWALAARPELTDGKQWGVFARNHDELTLDQLDDDERQEVFAAFGPEPEHQIFGRGLRRRVPPMLGGDQQYIEMVYSLVYSLPGTPVLYYGEEIGMGENLDIDGRLAVRTPMQWDDGDDAGFGSGEAACAVSRTPDGDWSPKNVNVADQLRDQHSLLAFFRRMGDHYHSVPELGRGEGTVLETPHRDVLAHRMTWGDRETVIVHVLGSQARTFDLVVPGLAPGAVLLDLFDETEHRANDDGTVPIDLPSHGYCWLRISPAGALFSL